MSLNQEQLRADLQVLEAWTVETLKEASRAIETPPPPAPATRPLYFKAMTLKIDAIRYERLKRYGFESGQTSQAILIDALDLFFKKHK